MRLKEIAISIDPASSGPMFLQIADQIVLAIQEGRLIPGAVLPGSRSLSEHLGVSRNTVNAAYSELMARGWIRGIERSGYCIAPLVIDTSQASLSTRTEESKGANLSFDLPTLNDLNTSQMSRVHKLSDGLPDPRLMPTEELGKAYFYALRHDPKGVLDYGMPHGYKPLRESLRDFLAEWRDLHTHLDSILVTRGTRMALNLLAAGLLKRGDRVAVENPGNPMAWEVFKQAKAHLVGIPVDADGLDVDALEQQLRRDRIRMLYLTPRFQIPTGVGLSKDRRKRLLELAQEYRFAIVEDDPDAEFTFEGSTIPPLAEGEGTGTVLHLFSFSRLLAPGVRLGLLTGPEQVVERLALLGKRVDGQGDQVLERAVGVLLQEGEIQRHLQRARKEYQQRRLESMALIQNRFGNRLKIQDSKGGLALWLSTDSSLDLELWCQRCAKRGIHFRPGRAHCLDHETLNGFLFGYAAFNPEEVSNILDIMAAECPI